MTTEMLQKAKECKSAEEILELAKANGIEMTAEAAKECYAKLHAEGEMSDDELDNVAGGACPGIFDFAKQSSKTAQSIVKNNASDDGIFIGDIPGGIPMDDKNKITRL